MGFNKETFNANQYSLLRDFNVLLDFVVEFHPEVSRKVNRISPKLVLELNSRLSEKINLDLKQHNQSSYPHINSLVLLLRASGLGIVVFDKDKLRLSLDEDLHQQWLKFNDTEQYFNLFVAWICNGIPSIIGIEQDLGSCFNKLANFMIKTLPQSGTIETDMKSLESASYSVGTHNLVLLEMFGFIEMKDNREGLSKKWEVKQIKSCQLGDYIFTELVNVLGKKDFFFYEENPFPPKTKDALLKRLKTIFPAFKSDLQIHNTEQVENGLVFKLSLGSIWRKIVVPIEYPLDFFCSYIIDCFDFDHSHLYKIMIKNRFGFNDIYTHPNVDDGYFGYPNSRDFTLKELHIKPGTTMDFVYDFGDNWQFEITCENAMDLKGNEPKVIDKKGEAPEQYR